MGQAFLSFLGALLRTARRVREDRGDAREDDAVRRAADEEEEIDLEEEEEEEG